MTRTCKTCNNGLGSRAEAALQQWYDNEVRVQFTSSGSPKPFGRDSYFTLQTDEGDFVLLADRPSADPTSPLERLHEPGVELHLSEPSPAEYLTGLLKNVYLATCLHFGCFPSTPTLMAARAELLSARDAVTREQVRLGPVAQELKVHRTGLPAHGPSLVLLGPERDGRPVYLVSLAGTVLVEWPFPDLDPMDSPRMPS